MRFAIYPFSLTCEGAVALRDYLREQGQKAILVKRDGVFEPKEGDFIIGWGYSKAPVWEAKAGQAWKWINKYHNIHHAVNKLAAFDILGNTDIPIPKYTKVHQLASSWSNNGDTVLARGLISSNQGKGITIVPPGGELPDAKFYSRVVPSTAEFRVYSLDGKTVDVLEKRRANGSQDPGIVRTEANGWVFCRQNVSLPPQCAILARQALHALGLQFGGVDVLWNKNTQKATVLEVNTAPGIFGTGIKKVGDAFLAYRKGVW